MWICLLGLCSSLNSFSMLLNKILLFFLYLDIQPYIFWFFFVFLKNLVYSQVDNVVMSLQKLSRINWPSFDLSFFSLPYFIWVFSYELFKLLYKGCLVVICLQDLFRRLRLRWISYLLLFLFVVLFLKNFVYHLHPFIHCLVAAHHQLPLFSFAVLDITNNYLPNILSCWQKCELFHFL